MDKRVQERESGKIRKSLVVCGKLPDTCFTDWLERKTTVSKQNDNDVPMELESILSISSDTTTVKESNEVSQNGSATQNKSAVNRQSNPTYTEKQNFDATFVVLQEDSLGLETAVRKTPGKDSKEHGIASDLNIIDQVFEKYDLGNTPEECVSNGILRLEYCHMAIVAADDASELEVWYSFLATLRKQYRTCFMMVVCGNASESPRERVKSFSAGANMFTSCAASMTQAAARVAQEGLSPALRPLAGLRLRQFAQSDQVSWGTLQEKLWDSGAARATGVAYGVRQTGGRRHACSDDLQGTSARREARLTRKHQRTRSSSGQFSQGSRESPRDSRRSPRRPEKTFSCPYCQLGGLSEEQLWVHCPLYHINEPNTLCITCPVCFLECEPSRRGKPFQVHLRNRHGLCSSGLVESEDAHRPDDLYSFALVVCIRSDGRILLVHEFANSGMWLPGGALNPRESFFEAARRETLEEAGIDVELSGVLRVEHSPHRGYTRMRVIFTARPVRERQLCKSLPCYESVGACWVDPKDVPSLPLRGNDPVRWIKYLQDGGTVYPLEVLGSESR